MAKESELDSQKITIGALKSLEPRFSWKVFLGWVVGIAVIFTLLFLIDPLFGEDPIFLYLGIVQAVVGGVFYYGGYVWLRRREYRSMLKRVLAHVEGESEVLQQDLGEDFFSSLVKINFKYIDRYYLQTQIQADKAFTMSAVAAFIGFAVIAVGIFQMYVGEAQPAYVTIAAGVVSEFIATVFFYLYSKTITRMSDYHRKLVLTQNVSLALRITQDLPCSERIKAQQVMVERLSEDINRFLADETMQVSPSI